jgi:hypothetical protein
MNTEGWNPSTPPATLCGRGPGALSCPSCHRIGPYDDTPPTTTPSSPSRWCVDHREGARPIIRLPLDYRSEAVTCDAYLCTASFCPPFVSDRRA